MAPRLVEPPEVTVALARGRAARVEALRACDEAQWRRCLEGLDAARALDPAGDASPRVRAARQSARDALEREEHAPAPSPPPDVYVPWESPPTSPPVPPRRRRPTVVIPMADASM